MNKFNINLRNEFLKNKNEYEQELLNSINTTNSKIIEILKAIQHLDKRGIEVKDKYLKQLMNSCENDWLAANEWFDKNEKFNAILFEYQCFHGTIFYENEPAIAYGIVSEELMQNPFDGYLDNNYDFSSNIEAVDGIILPSFNFISNGKIEKTKIEFNDKYLDLDEFHQLMEIYLYQQKILLQEALHEFVDTQVFQKLNISNTFQFMLGEHDLGENPIYYLID